MHYKMYIYSFCKKQEAELKVTCVEDYMEECPVPIPLSQLVKEEEWLQQQEEKERKRLEEDDLKKLKEVRPAICS